MAFDATFIDDRRGGDAMAPADHGEAMVGLWSAVSEKTGKNKGIAETPNESPRRGAT